MEKDFDSILDKCLSQIRTGKVDVKSCLNQYPEHAARLRPLLETAALLWQKPQPQPRPEAVSRGEQLMLGRVAEKRSSKALRKGLVRTIGDKIDIGRSGPGGSSFLPPRWRPRWVGVVAGILALFMLSGGVVAASSYSMPGELLYPVKIATEQTRLVLTPSEVGKAKLHITLAGHRMEEIAEMSRRGQAEQVAKLVPMVVRHLEEAKQVIMVIGEGKDAQELKTKLEESAVQQLAGLEGALEQATEDTKPVIAQALETSGESYGTAIEAAITAAPAPLLVGKMGTIQILVTDPPPPRTVDNVTVEVAIIEVHLAGGPDSGWITVVDESRSFDLMELVGGKELDLGDKEVNAGTYTQVRMEITQATVIVGGKEHDAKVPSGKLKFVRPFKVEEDGTTVLLLDFDGQKSVHVTGKGRYMLKPVVKLFVPKQSSPPEAKGKGAEELKFEGIIKDLPDHPWIGIWLIDDQEVEVDADTVIKGTPEVDLIAEVEALVRPDESLLAIEIEVEEAEAEIEFEGTITSLEPLVIAGYTVILDGADIEGELAMGRNAEVEGLLQDEDTVLALKIKVEEGETEIEFEGTITSLEPLVIAGYTVILDGADIEGELAMGRNAEVEGLLQDEDTVLALKIKVEEAE